MGRADAPSAGDDISPTVAVTPAAAAGHIPEERVLHRSAATGGAVAGLVLVGCAAAERDDAAAPCTPGEAIRSALAWQQGRAMQTDERSGPGPVAEQVGQVARLVGRTTPCCCPSASRRCGRA